MAASSGGSFDGIIAAGVEDGSKTLRRRTWRLAGITLSTLAALSLCCGGAYLWMSAGAERRAAALSRSDCRRMSNSAVESYNRALGLYGEVSSAFGSFDDAYDLDALAELVDERPEPYRAAECSSDIAGDERDARDAALSYDLLSKRYEGALSTNGD